MQTVWNWIKDNWPLLLAILTGPIGIAVLLITKNWDTIKDVLGTAIDFMVGLWNGFVSFVTGLPTRIWNAIQQVGQVIVNVFSWGINQLSGLIDGAVGWFRGLPDRILGALGSLGRLLYGIGKDIIDGLLDGIKAGFNAVKDFVSGIGDTIKSLKGPLAYDRVMLVPQGKAIMQGLRAGMASEWGNVQRDLAGYTGALATSPTGTGGAASGGATFNINVAVAPGTSPAVVGAAVVDQIRAYERVAGRSWRK